MPDTNKKLIDNSNTCINNIRYFSALNLYNIYFY